jgi:seryl-tRNA synthetase
MTNEQLKRENDALLLQLADLACEKRKYEECAEWEYNLRIGIAKERNELMQERDTLKSEVKFLKRHIKISSYMQDIHREDCRHGAELKKESDSLKAEVERLEKALKSLDSKNEYLFNRIEETKDERDLALVRVEKLREALDILTTQTRLCYPDDKEAVQNIERAIVIASDDQEAGG